jgi:outer membrane immunogenic protein
MKKSLLGTVGLVALGMSAPASATDMPVRSSLPAPPVMYN